MGNTFLNMRIFDPEDEAVPASKLIKAHSVPEFLPYYLAQGLVTQEETSAEGTTQNALEASHESDDTASCEGSSKPSSEYDATTDCSDHARSVLECGRSSTSAGDDCYDAEAASSNGDDASALIAITTVIIRNMPHDFTQIRLAKALSAAGFAKRMDFLYMPSTFGSQRSKGYAFVNFIHHHDAMELINMWHNKHMLPVPPDWPLLDVSPATVQGLAANLGLWSTSKMRRIRNTSHRPLVLSSNAVLAGLTGSSPASSANENSPSSKTAPKRTPQKARMHTKELRPMQQVTGDVGHDLVGQSCMICGLKKDAQANGFWGQVQAFNCDGSYRVTTKQGGGLIVEFNVLPRNLLWSGSADLAPVAAIA